MSKFFQSFDTKHLIIGICCTLAGWGYSQIYTLGLNQSAMQVYVEKHSEVLEALSPLPQQMVTAENRLEVMDTNHIIIFENLHNQESKIFEHDTRISVLEAQISEEEM